MPRRTFRSYTVLDPTSPIFLRGDTVYVPCVFVSALLLLHPPMVWLTLSALHGLAYTSIAAFHGPAYTSK